VGIPLHEVDAERTTAPVETLLHDSVEV
jgi:hypothetical protein